MDPIKFVVRAIMRGEVKVFRHRFSLQMQLIHGHRHRGGEDESYEESVVTKCSFPPLVMMMTMINQRQHVF